MSHRTRRQHGLRDWVSKKHTQHFEANERDECSISTCYFPVSFTTPTGVKFCSGHYANWLRNNPLGGKPVDRTDVYDEDDEDDDDYPDLERDEDIDDYENDPYGDDFDPEAYEDEVESWKDDLPHGEGWEAMNTEACPFCGKVVDTVYSLLSDEAFVAYNAEAGIEVWGPADAPKEVLCKGWHKDWEAELIVHFKSTETDEERLVFLEGKPK